MTAERDADVFLTKAAESLASANADFSADRYNSCANRCYYACYQAAVAALSRAGWLPADGRPEHSFVQAEFNGRLVNRQKLYDRALRSVLPDLMQIRVTADYAPSPVSRSSAAQALRWATRFVDAVTSR